MDLLLLAALLAIGALAQDFDVTVPSSCTSDYAEGVDTTLLTVPYPPSAVIDIIGSFKNLTWSAVPADNVTLNGTNNEINTARAYSLSGLPVTETLVDYYRPDLTCFGVPFRAQTSRYPADVAFSEQHNAARIDFEGDLVYMPAIVLSASSRCLGGATLLNYTSQFCATDGPKTASTLHELHTTDFQMVQAMLGNASYTGCDGLMDEALYLTIKDDIESGSDDCSCNGD
ncbi:MAG: hypothetical protein Q9162_006129 [Coniocarpon cinnabarinum]